MRILVTNDDGIYARGITSLRRHLQPYANVLAVAPMEEKSGTGHSITLHRPLKVHAVKEDGEIIGYGVDGTPADCVKIAVCELMKRPPDLVISGINPGGNLSTNVMYSGTVSAAMEACLLGFPSIAVSIDGFRARHQDYAAELALKLALSVHKTGLPPGVLLNVNIPDINPSEIKGIKTTVQGTARFIESFKRRRDPRGNNYYWLDGHMADMKPVISSDYAAVQDGYVSVTPLQLDRTSKSSLRCASKIIKGL